MTSLLSQDNRKVVSILMEIRFFEPSARCYYVFGVLVMFLASETIILARVFHFFRACGALFFPNNYVYNCFRV